MAASMIIAKKEAGEDIWLIFALPCQNQEKNWLDGQKDLYRCLLLEADEIIYVSDEYTYDCMKKRNYFMVDNSDYFICALIYENTGTAQTVDYARQKGLCIVSVV